MQLDVAWTADEVSPQWVAGSTAVVIDVLRATTMIATLLEAGVREVWPVTTVAEAEALAARLASREVGLPSPGDGGGPAAKAARQAAGVLLAGERHGLPPAGFDLGNSPVEVRPAEVAGKRVVLTTTNGTKAIQRSAQAAALITAAFVNAGAVVRWLVRESPDRICIVCAGTDGRFSLEDALCAGAILARLMAARGGGGRLLLSDAALAAVGLYERFESEVAQRVATCAHGRNLTALGLGADVAFAAEQDTLEIVPVRSPDRPQTIVRGESA